MTTKPWPCWTCKWRSKQPDVTETYSCERPSNLAALSIWERWRLERVPKGYGRYIGSERALRGEGPNKHQDCPVAEVAR